MWTLWPFPLAVKRHLSLAPPLLPQRVREWSINRHRFPLALIKKKKKQQQWKPPSFDKCVPLASPHFFLYTQMSSSTLCVQFLSFFKKNLFILFIYFWLRWVFIAVCGSYLVAASGGYSSLWCTGFSLRWPLLLQSMGSRNAGLVVVAHRVQSAGSAAVALGPSCSPACGILLTQGLNPCPLHWHVDSTTVPPGKPCVQFLTLCLLHPFTAQIPRAKHPFC